MQVVVTEQDRTGLVGIATVTGETFTPAELGPAAVAHDRDQLTRGNLVLDHVTVAADRERHRVIEKIAYVADDLLSAHRVILGGSLAAFEFGNDIGAVERIVETVPARVSGIERITRIVDRHHQLRTGNRAHLGIDIRRGDLEIALFRHQVADFLEIGLILCGVDAAEMVLVPGIELRLQFIPQIQQLPVLRSELLVDIGERLPEGCTVDAGSGRDFAID